MSFSKCPIDNTIAVIGSLWLEFLAPWKYALGAEAQWDHWVGNNYFFYYILLIAFLDYAHVMASSFGDALAAPKTYKKREGVPKETLLNVLMPLLILLEKVLVLLEPLAPLLRRIEDTELVPNSIASTSTSLGTFNITPVLNVKEQLRALECDNFHLTLLFSETRERVLSLLYWLETIHDCNVPEPIKETIIRCQEEIYRIFNIDQEDYIDYSERFQAMRRLEALGPTTDLTQLTRRSKFGVPFVDPDDKIAVKMRTRADERTVKSYEGALLVELSCALSEWFNEQYAHLMAQEQLNWLPISIRNRRFNFRFLAAYPNLLFFLLVYLFSGAILKVIRAVFF